MGKSDQHNFRLVNYTGCSKSTELFIYLFGKTDARINGVSHKDNLYFFIIALLMPTAYSLKKNP
jgi:hypothetical protein